MNFAANASPILVGIVIVYHVLSRLAYAVGVGRMLLSEQRHQSFSRDGGIEAGFRRFRGRASRIMTNDAISFGLLCAVTFNWQTPPLPVPWLIGGAIVLIITGIAVKMWAAKSLPPDTYYWHNFFTNAPYERLPNPGPYRYFNNPMYTVGYAHAYGFALLSGSVIGLIAAVFDQVAVLTFHHLVEKPHFEMLVARAAATAPATEAR